MRLSWDDIGSRYYKSGIDRGVLYPYIGDSYQSGVSWSGLTSIEHTISGRQKTVLYTADIKSRILLTPEEYGGSISAFFYPDEFETCMGNAVPIDGLIIGQQPENSFGMTYRTRIGNDVEGGNAAYQLHFLYGAVVISLTDTDNTVGGDPDLQPLTWSFECVPVPLDRYRPIAHMFIDSRKFDREFLANLEEIIWGTADTDPRLPYPDEIYELLRPVDENALYPTYDISPSGELHPVEP